MTTRISLLLVAAAAAALAGCSETSDPAGAAPETAKSVPNRLVGIEAAHYAIVRVDDGVLHAARVGASETKCADGIARRTCALGSLDLTRLDLSPNDEMLARARISDGTAIVRAKLGSSDSGDGGTLVATAVWLRRATSATLAATRAPTSDVFVLRNVREGCEVASDKCAWLRAEPLTGGRAAHYSELDVSLLTSGLDEGTGASIARGEALAYGASIGSKFVVASVYVPFGVPASAPVVHDPAERAPVN